MADRPHTQATHAEKEELSAVRDQMSGPKPASRPMTDTEKAAYLKGKAKGRAEALTETGGDPLDSTPSPRVADFPDVVNVRVKKAGLLSDLNDVLKLAVGIWAGLCLFALTVLVVTGLMVGRVADAVNEARDERLDREPLEKDSVTGLPRRDR